MSCKPQMLRLNDFIVKLYSEHRTSGRMRISGQKKFMTRYRMMALEQRVRRAHVDLLKKEPELVEEKRVYPYTPEFIERVCEECDKLLKSESMGESLPKKAKLLKESARGSANMEAFLSRKLCKTKDNAASQREDPVEDLAK